VHTKLIKGKSWSLIVLRGRLLRCVFRIAQLLRKKRKKDLEKMNNTVTREEETLGQQRRMMDPFGKSNRAGPPSIKPKYAGGPTLPQFPSATRSPLTPSTPTYQTSNRGSPHTETEKRYSEVSFDMGASRDSYYSKEPYVDKDLSDTASHYSDDSDFSDTSSAYSDDSYRNRDSRYSYYTDRSSYYSNDSRRDSRQSEFDFDSERRHPPPKYSSGNR
jgi:hypothetical protein